MAAKKTKKSKVSKKKTARKPASKKTPVVDPAQEELIQLRREAAEKDEQLRLSKENLEALERQNKELEEIAEKMTETPPGAPVVTGGPSDSELNVEIREADQRAAERERERVREQARAERARRKQERRAAQERKQTQPTSRGSKVASLADARAKQASQALKAVAPPAVEKNEGPKTFPMDELHKYKLTVLNSAYNGHLSRIKAPLLQKYNLMMKAELDALSRKDAECMKARRDQVECVNEIIAVTASLLPPGYAITSFKAEEGVVVAEYVPERAGKPLPMPDTVPDEG